LKNLKISDFDPMRMRAGISTSEIHFIISKTVSAVREDAQKCPCPLPKDKSSSTKKFFRKKNFSLHYRPEKYADSIGEIRF